MQTQKAPSGEETSQEPATRSELPTREIGLRAARETERGATKKTRLEQAPRKAVGRAAPTPGVTTEGERSFRPSVTKTKRWLHFQQANPPPLKATAPPIMMQTSTCSSRTSPPSTAGALFKSQLRTMNQWPSPIKQPPQLLD